MAILVGVIVAVPICAIIYLSVSSLEKSSHHSKEIFGLTETITSAGSFIDEESGLKELAESLENAEAFPVLKRITNQNQQSLDVVVTGRTEEALHFLSLRDNRHYFYPINELIWKDQIFSKGLPIWVPKEGEFPLPRQLRDGVGRPLVTMIEGRSEHHVFFRTLAGGDLHAYPIHRLSPADRTFILGLPASREESGGAKTRIQLDGSRLEPSGPLNSSGRRLPTP